MMALETVRTALQAAADALTPPRNEEEKAALAHVREALAMLEEESNAVD